MPIKANDTRLYTGAASMLVPPVTLGDCAKYPSLEELVVEENKAGRGATIRHGVAYAKRTTVELAESCAAWLTPVPTGSNPTKLTWGAPATMLGTGFYDVAAEVHLGEAALWVDCYYKDLQPLGLWLPTSIVVTSVMWAHGGVGAYVYVLNKYGLRNAAGLRREFEFPP